MKLKRLDLKAFGPFTNRILEFNSQGPGLHVIFGPNEAGKSSSLRGLKALLFGFHSQTSDNFLHSYDQLLVGGTLENVDGKELVFLRRKKRLNDLIDVHGDPLDTSHLAAFLHGVEADIFESLYGINHDRLVQGGKEILAQQGEVGKSLFAAGAGISSLRMVTEQLEQEASALFKVRGSNPEINQAIKRYKELQKQLKEVSLAPKEWKELRNDLEDAEATRKNLEQERTTIDRELRRLDRLKQAIPELASLAVWCEKRAALGDIITLPADIQEKHQKVQQDTYRLEGLLQQSTERLQLVKEKIAGISINTELLKHHDLVDDFHQRLGEYRKGQQDRPQLNGMRMSLRRQADSFLKQVRPDLDLKEIESIRPLLAKKRVIQTLSSQFQAISQNQAQTKKRWLTAQKEFEEVTNFLSVAPTILDTQELSLAVKIAQKAGDLDTQLHHALRDIAHGRQECEKDMQRIGLWSGTLSALLELQLPLPQTIQRFEEKFRQLEEDKRALAKEYSNTSLQLAGAETELQKIQYGTEIPTENDLRDTRQKRDTGWQLLRRQWLDGEDVAVESEVFALEQSLHETYEGLVSKADLIADRLRHEADRVAQQANFKAQVQRYSKVLKECKKTSEELEQREKILLQEWSGTWNRLGISALSPGEMAGWLNSMEKLRYRIENLHTMEKDVQNNVDRRQELVQTLKSTLASMGVKELPPADDLGPVLLFAEDLLDKNSEEQNRQKLLLERRKKGQENVARTREEYQEAEVACTTWQEQWQKAISGLAHIRAELTPVEAMDYLETLQHCLDTEKEATDLQKRIAGIDRDAENLETAVKSLLEETAPSLIDLPVDQAILQLRVFLKQAQEDKALTDRLIGEKESLQAEISLVKKNLQDTNTQMRELLTVARCRTPDELGPAISRFLEQQKVQEKIAACEVTLARIGEGATIDELRAQAAAIDPDEIPVQIDSLQKDREERVHPAINSISQKIGEYKKGLAAMDGVSTAADVSEKMEQQLAKIKRLAEQYMKVKLAANLLQQEIERYREKHQDPVLQRASRYFAELTLNSYAGLRTDVGEKGEPILEGIRADEKWINVYGMSDGTRDQLYLALRLATLEWRLETSEPVPFIVDDILINFDDDRSRATLKALARFSRKNQVILFTHHRQLADDAEIIGQTEEVVVHML